MSIDVTALVETFEPADIFDDIRAGYRFVADHAAHVTIHEDRLAEYALSLQPGPPSNVLDHKHHFSSDNPEALAAYIFSLEAINFGSGYEDDLVREGWPRIDNSIYFTVSTALKVVFEAHGPWTAKNLCALSVDDMHRIFHLPRKPMGSLLAEQFVSSLNELGSVVDTQYGGLFTNLINAAEGRAARLVNLVGAIPGFRDVVDYRGRQISVLKRAQITAADLQQAFSGIGVTLFSDINRLTIFADNALPHVLRMDGVLGVSPDLERRLNAGIFLPPGSDEEIELRCCAAEAIERLAAIKGMRVLDIDHLIWHRSVEDPKYAERPAHRTLTSFY